MTRLIRLAEDFGQSPWLDNLERGDLTSGRLAEMRDRGVRGVTSNPTILQRAMTGSTDYDAQYRTLLAGQQQISDSYWTMAIDDVNAACEVLDVVHAASAGLDGYVSLEVDPSLAHDGQATERAARGLHERIDRPNLMVKIPGTPAGVSAFRRMTAEGRKVNVTLLFGLDRYQAVMDAYLDGLEAYAAVDGADLSSVTSVASFFISRVDAEVDRRLEAIGTDAALALRGRAAVAQAALAYQRHVRTFSGPRWEALAARGARPQRPLWASTSTKNPSYPDTLYVDRLIGPGTVNTMPMATLDAFVDHGTLSRTLDDDLDDARDTWSALGEVGIDMADVAARLEDEGIAAFQKSFDELLDALQRKRDELA